MNRHPGLVDTVNLIMMAVFGFLFVVDLSMLSYHYAHGAPYYQDVADVVGDVVIFGFNALIYSWKQPA